MDKMPFLGVREEPSDIYHQNPAMSSHRLMQILRSPAHYKSGLTAPRKVTTAMAYGHIVHAALLEPKRFIEKCAVEPEVNKRTKAGKQELEEWQLSLDEGAIICTNEQVEQTRAMIESLDKHPVAGNLLRTGVAEQSLYFTEKESGVYCKARPDWLRYDGIVIDLKTALDASYSAFQRSIANYNYNVQAGMYLTAASEVFKCEYHTYIFIVVEKEPPWAIAVYVADATVVETGKSKMRDGLNRFVQCTKSGHWPGYQVEAENISMPHWALFD